MEGTASAIYVLIVEDFHGDTEIVLRELQDAEIRFTHEVVRAEAEFEEALEKRCPDIILSPYSLAGTNAIKLMKIVQRTDCNIPFILLAYDLSEDIAIDLLSEGVEDYILRSTIKRLPVAVRKALQRNLIQQELRLSEAELRRSEASLREAQKIAKVGSWEWEVGSDDVRWSEEMYSIYETDRKGITLTDVKRFIHPEDRDYVDKLTEGDLTDGFRPIVEYRVALESGTIKHVVSSARQIRDAAGNVCRLIGTLQDVTERVESEQRLELERTRRELAIQAARVGIWHWPLDGTAIHLDERCQIMFGNEQTSIEAVDYRKLIHPDDLEHVDDRIRKAMQNGQYRAEYRMVLKGETRYVLSQGRVSYDEQERPVRLDGILMDITERHEMERELREREQLFRDMAESVSEVFWLTDWELNKVLYVSPRYETLYGLPCDELYEDPGSWSKAIHPDDLDRVTGRFREQAFAGEYDEEYRLVMPDGQLKWVRDRAFPVFDKEGNVSRVAGITQEITQAKHDQEWIQTLSLVASETINGVLIQDREGAIIWANNGFCNITGFEKTEVLGKEPWSFLSGKRTNKRLTEMTYEKVMSGKPFRSENVLVRKDGREVWIATTFTPVFDENGDMKHIVSIGTDVTAQKELEELQRDALGRLKSEVERQSGELENLRKQNGTGSTGQ